MLIFSAHGRCLIVFMGSFPVSVLSEAALAAMGLQEWQSFQEPASSQRSKVASDGDTEKSPIKEHLLCAGHLLYMDVLVLTGKQF